MGKRINFASMFVYDLPEYAEAGYQRAQYFLGKACLEKNSFHDISDDPEQLQLAEKWLLAAIRNPGIDPDDTKQRGDYKKYRDMAKLDLSRMYAHLARKNRANRNEPHKPQYNEQGMENLLKVVELGVDPYFISTVAMQYLRGGIPNLGERNTGERGRAFAIALLVNAAPVENTSAEHYLSEIYKDTKALDIGVALGKAKILSSYRKLSRNWTYYDGFEEGFKLIEGVGNHDINGYHGYKLAKAALDSLELIGREEMLEADKRKLRAQKRRGALGGRFERSAEAVESKPELSPLLKRVIQARQFIETAKMGSDADFDASPA